MIPIIIDTLETGKGFPASSMIRNPSVNKRDTGDTGSIPGSGRSPGKEMSAHSSILAWRIPWTEEAVMLQSVRVTQSQT